MMFVFVLTQRLNHNMLEKQRRSQMKHRFSLLKKEVGHDHMSKQSTLMKVRNQQRPDVSQLHARRVNSGCGLLQATELIGKLLRREQALKRRKRRLKRRRDEYMSLLVPSSGLNRNRSGVLMSLKAS